MGYKEKNVLRLGDITRFSADNGQGKTSIGEAITWAFLGSNLWGNDKADSLLMNNSSGEMEVTIHFLDEKEKKHTLIRSRTKDITIITLDNKEIKQANLCYMLGNKNIFLSIFNPMYFHSMSQKQAREFIISILPEIRIEDIIEKIDDFELNYIKDDLVYIHNNPNKYIKDKRDEIKEIDEDLIYIEGILSTLEPRKKDESIDETFLKNLEQLKQEILIKKGDLERLTLKKQNIEKEKIVIENKKTEPIDTTELYKEKINLEKTLELTDIKEYTIDKDIQRKIITLENETKDLREQYAEKNKTIFKEGDVCSTCKSTITKHHFATLEKDKKIKLAEILNLGKEKVRELNNIITKEKELKEKFDTLRADKINELKNSIKNASDEIEKIEKENNDSSQKLEITKRKILNEINDNIDILKNNIKTVKIELEEMEEQYYELKSKKELEEKQIIENEKKFIELQKQIETHNKNAETYRTQIAIAQNYINLKVKMLSKTVQENLEDVEIVLQKVIKSTGELKDIFEIKYKGKDFRVLSTSEEIKAGLEISDLVINQTKLYYPIFIDNGESITRYDVKNNVQIIETRVEEDVYHMDVSIKNNTKTKNNAVNADIKMAI